MIRSELIGKLVETHPHLARPEMEAALDAIPNDIINGLAQGQKVEARGFGNFFQQGPGSADESGPPERQSCAGSSQAAPAFQSHESAL